MLYLFFFQLTHVLLTGFIFNHTFLLNMLYDYIVIYDYKTEGKKERKKKKKEIQQLVTRQYP